MLGQENVRLQEGYSVECSVCVCVCIYIYIYKYSQLNFIKQTCCMVCFLPH